MGDTGVAGSCQIARGIAVDPATGHLYVADQGNSRIVELTAWGEFVKAWGWGVRDGSAELQTCTTATGCRAGIAGAGRGQLDSPQGLAVDSEGNVYVMDGGNKRVQKFSPAGQFLLMFGGDVNRTKVEEPGATAAERNLCPVAPTDVCQAGTVGNGPGQFASYWPGVVDAPAVRSYVAVNAADQVYVGDVGRIQRFDTQGRFQGQISMPGDIVSGLAVGSEGNLYVTVCVPDGWPCKSGNSPIREPGSFPEVRKLSPDGTLLNTLAVDDPNALATDTEGNLYVLEGQTTIFNPLTISAYDGAGQLLWRLHPTAPVKSTGLAVSSACGIDGVDVYASDTDNAATSVSAFGSAPDPAVCPPPKVQPTVTEQHARTVGTESAVVAAEINPHFWIDTTYYLQWGTADCRTSPGSCGETELLPDEAELGSDGSSPVETVQVHLSGLQPNTTYHYRFVARSGGSDGRPVFGEGDPACALEPSCGRGSSFTTYAPLTSGPETCPNAAHRTGASARLPDCRAYELVSPVDKAGGDIVPLHSIQGDPSSLDQSASDGDRLTYSSYRAFSDPISAPWTSQYLATRGAGGWSSAFISAPREGPRFIAGSADQDTDYKEFSDDLCSGWLFQNREPVLSAAAPAGYPNLYRRQNCGPSAGGFEALIDAPPQDGASQVFPAFRGRSADGTRVIFQARGGLAAGANPSVSQLYESYLEGGTRTLRLVCILPGGTPSAESCTAAGSTPSGGPTDHRRGNVLHAISEGGSRIYWANGDGGLYVRVDGRRTIQVAAPSTRLTNSFRGAAADGSGAIYLSGAELRRFDLGDETSTPIAPAVSGVMGMSSDARRVYFTSSEVLTEDEANSLGAKAVSGEPNLYLYDADAPADPFEYVATLAPSDIGGAGLSSSVSPVAEEPIDRRSRVSDDGAEALFMSAAGLTGGDNVAAQSGEPAAEVYLFDLGSGDLLCVSCNPTGARPIGRELRTSSGFSTGQWAASQIPAWISQTYAPRVLSEGGDRVFFESSQPLVLADTNEAQDVYEWQRVVGTGQDGTEECRARHADLFSARSGGCLSLISTGKSPADSGFVDASADGDDVFIKTQSSLVPQDPDLLDVYDARVGGGFDPPAPVAPPCEGEACQGAAAAPEEIVPASSSYRGPSNRASRPAKKGKRSCPKRKQAMKRHGRRRCVAKRRAVRRHGKHRRMANGRKHDRNRGRRR